MISAGGVETAKIGRRFAGRVPKRCGPGVSFQAPPRRSQTVTQSRFTSASIGRTLHVNDIHKMLCLVVRL
jgi:hypothetical protein